MEPQDRVKEWPERTNAFYFVKIRSFKDPDLRRKLMEAENEFQKKIEARNKIIEVARAKKVLFFLFLMHGASFFIQQEVHVLLPCLNGRMFYCWPNMFLMVVDSSRSDVHALTMFYYVLQPVLYLQEERSNIISELKSLYAENKQYHVVVEVLQNHLGKFRNGNNTMQAQGCSVVEELEQTVFLNPWSTQLPLP